MSYIPFIGEIRTVSFDYAPKNWMLCHGQTLNIVDNLGLFAVIGNRYGGDGKTTFKLPDFRGRHGIGQGQGDSLTNRKIGEVGRTEKITLQENNIPMHKHEASISADSGAITMKMAYDQADMDDPTNAMFGRIKSGTVFQKAYRSPSTAATKISMAPEAISIDSSKFSIDVNDSGSGLGFDVMTPYVVVNYIIAANGIYPEK